MSVHHRLPSCFIGINFADKKEIKSKVLIRRINIQLFQIRIYGW